MKGTRENILNDEKSRLAVTKESIRKGEDGIARIPDEMISATENVKMDWNTQ